MNFLGETAESPLLTIENRHDHIVTVSYMGFQYILNPKKRGKQAETETKVMVKVKPGAKMKADRPDKSFPMIYLYCDTCRCCQPTDADFASGVLVVDPFNNPKQRK